MKKACWILLASCLTAAPAAAQSQYQTTFEFGLGYTRPATQPRIASVDMVSLLLQGDDYFLETGFGIRTKSGFDSKNLVSWLVRAGARPFVIGNTTGHVGGEFSLHTNATTERKTAGVKATTLLGVGLLFGVSHSITDHFSFGLHIYPLAFDFGGDDTITRIGQSELSAHVLF